MTSKQIKLLVSGVAVILVSIYYFQIAMEEKVYCGTVTHKINALKYNKHNATPDPIMIVDFDGIGKREIHPTWITFSDNEIGSRVCFSRKVSDMEDDRIDGGLLSLFLMFGFLGGSVLILAGLNIFNTDTDNGY
jgi:hypothetical protein